MSFESEDKIKYKLHNCPFCWNSELTMYEDLETIYVRCVKCGAYGPHQNSDFNAAKCWNQSPDPLKQQMPWKIAFIITTTILAGSFVFYFLMLFFNRHLFLQIYEYRNVAIIIWLILLVCDIIIQMKWKDSKIPPISWEEIPK